jgi:C-terminal processing protease CtpA/Prc
MRTLLVSLLFLFSFPAFCQVCVGKKISKQQLINDLNLVIRTVENVHPNPYHAITKENFAQLADSLRNSFKEHMTAAEAWPLYSKLMALYNEGHSSIGYPEELQNQIRQDSLDIFPILVREFNGEQFVVRYDLSPDSSIATGDLITKINDRPAKELMNYFTSFYGGLENWKKIQVLRDFGGMLALFNINAPYKIEYIHDGKKKERIINGIKLSELLAKAAEVRKRNPVQPVQANYTFNRTDGNIGYLNFRSMKELQVFEKFLDSVFTNIKNNPIEGLIIDLRMNSGGSSTLGQSLLNYINGKPYRMGGGSMWKTSDEYKIFIQEQSKTNAVYASGSFKNYLNKESGEVITQLDTKTFKPGKNELRYSGKLCVLIGPNTFSSANMLANAIKDYKLATLIGEATGEAPNDFGELYWNKLPNTGLTFYTCTKQFIRANGDADDPDPIFPDIEVKQNSKSLKDDVLEFSKEWIKKN